MSDLTDRHRHDVERQAAWAAEALARPNWGTVTVVLLPRDGTNYEVTLSERVAPDGRRAEGVVVSLLRSGSAAYVWHPGGYMDPLYVAQSWRIGNSQTAAVLAHFLTKLGEALAADDITPLEPSYVSIEKYRVMERMRDEARASADAGLLKEDEDD